MKRGRHGVSGYGCECEIVCENGFERVGCGLGVYVNERVVEWWAGCAWARLRVRCGGEVKVR